MADSCYELFITHTMIAPSCWSTLEQTTSSFWIQSRLPLIFESLPRLGKVLAQGAGTTRLRVLRPDSRSRHCWTTQACWHVCSSSDHSSRSRHCGTTQARWHICSSSEHSSGNARLTHCCAPVYQDSK
eukprot:3017479-Rhodomonas_salina.1